VAVAVPINHLRYKTSRFYDNGETKARGNLYRLLFLVFFFGVRRCDYLGKTFVQPPHKQPSVAAIVPKIVNPSA
jgi:hypothetical protein